MLTSSLLDAVPALWPVVLVVVAALLASTLAAVTGTGGGVILLPVLVSLLGVRDAIPAYTLAQFIGNLSRVGFNRREIRPHVVAWFTLGAVPMAVVGAVLFTRADDQVLVRLLGGFLIGTVLWRHVRGRRSPGFPVRRFTIVGGVFGFISALVGSAGPFLAPFFLAYGLTRGAYIGTEALATAIMHVTKMATYGAGGAFSCRALFWGAILGPIMIVGSYAGKRIIDRLPDRVFVVVIEVLLVAFGLLFILRG